VLARSKEGENLTAHRSLETERIHTEMTEQFGQWHRVSLNQCRRKKCGKNRKTSVEIKRKTSTSP
jgi:hypothetical protein